MELIFSHTAIWFHLGFLKNSHGTINQTAIRVSLRVYARYNISLPHGTITKPPPPPPPASSSSSKPFPVPGKPQGLAVRLFLFGQSYISFIKLKHSNTYYAVLSIAC